MSVIPRVALVPSISEDTGPLSAFCIVRSPAPNILVSKYYLLVFRAQVLIYSWQFTKMEFSDYGQLMMVAAY